MQWPSSTYFNKGRMNVNFLWRLSDQIQRQRLSPNETSLLTDCWSDCIPNCLSELQSRIKLTNAAYNIVLLLAYCQLNCQKCGRKLSGLHFNFRVEKSTVDKIRLNSLIVLICPSFSSIQCYFKHGVFINRQSKILTYYLNPNLIKNVNQIV